MADTLKTPKILVVDDDPKIRWVLRQGLEDDNYDVEEADDGLEAIKKYHEFQPDLILMDVKMPAMDGLEAMSRIRENNTTVPVIILSAFPDSKIIVQAMKNGAEDFLIKPFDIEMVKMIITKTLEHEGMKEEIEKLKGQLELSAAYGQFVGESAPMREIKQQIEQVADSELNILIEGESGTGKEIVARLLHQRSARSRHPFIKVNCAALPEHLLESELFGYEKGAFTGAMAAKPGRFELADGGTIFLDEIGEMPLSLQAKLLQVLEHKEFFRVGGKKQISVDVRILSATNIDMQKNIENSIFRSDLYFRLNDVTISLPPLRSRLDDLALLFEHFTLKYSKQYGKEPILFSEKVETELSTYAWPGNVRELESFIKRMVVLGYENALRQLKGAGAFSVPKTAGAIQGASSAHRDSEADEPIPDTYSLKVIAQGALSKSEKRAIRRALEKTKWNKKKAAELLEISYRSLLYKIKEYGI